MRLQFHPLGCLAHDRFDHRAHHRNGDRVAGRAFDRDDGGRHRSSELVDGTTMEERRKPPNRRIDAVALSPSSDSQAGHDGTLCSEANTFDGGTAEPQQARTDASGILATAHGDQPTERAAHRDGDGIGLHTAGKPHPRMDLPPVGRTTHCLQPVGKRIVRFRFGAATGGPHHHATFRPRGLQLHLARLEVLPRDRVVVVELGKDGRRGQRAQAGCGAMQALQRVGEVGNHLIALVTLDVAHGGEVFLGIPDQAIEHRQGPRLVDLEQRQVVGGGAIVGDRPDRSFELSYLSHGAPYE